MKNISKKIYLALIILFLYLPIFVLIVASFNDSKILGNWDGFTLNWYRELFDNASIMNALKTTLILALLASIIATVLGTLACLTISKMKKSTRTIIMSITNIPMLNAEIVTALAFMLLFRTGHFAQLFNCAYSSCDVLYSLCCTQCYAKGITDG